MIKHQIFVNKDLPDQTQRKINIGKYIRFVQIVSKDTKAMPLT